jgi:hypothetical protein
MEVITGHLPAGRGQQPLQERPPADGSEDVRVLVATLRDEIRALEEENVALKRELARSEGSMRPATRVVDLVPYCDQLLSFFSPVYESDEDREARGRVRTRIEDDRTRRQCTFYFVTAEHVRHATSTLPQFQELWQQEGAIVEKSLEETMAYRSAYAGGEILAVSHRWEAPSQPDTEGAQWDAIRRHLQANPHIRLVWYDYWCMPQGTRSRAEGDHFKWMLQHINLLYLGCSVLILLDISYLSRFWTQMEAWLSMQLGGSDGLEPAPERLRRCAIEFLHTATTTTRTDLLNMWATRTPEEAYALLSKPDVQVTNQSDKVTQLAKVRQLVPEVKGAFTPRGAAALEGETAWTLGARGFSAAVLRQALPRDDQIRFIEHASKVARASGLQLREACGESFVMDGCEVHGRALITSRTALTLTGMTVAAARVVGALLCANDTIPEVTLNNEAALPVQQLRGSDSLDLSEKKYGPASAAAIGAMISVNASLTKIE